jgi:hypothetical protein
MPRKREMRQGRGKPIEMTEEEWAAIQRITREIMEGMDCFQPSVFERHIEQVLARNIMAAAQAYELQAADETVHKWEFGEHPISRCQVDWCGRYRGQRRDSTAIEPPPAPGPAAYCARCARSGVGACDDFPNCPGGYNVPEYKSDPGWPPQER